MNDEKPVYIESIPSEAVDLPTRIIGHVYASIDDELLARLAYALQRDPDAVYKFLYYMRDENAHLEVNVTFAPPPVSFTVS